MDMVRLIYVSRMTDTCDMEAIHDILQQSRKNNAAKDITGILCYDPFFFLQCLEGPRDDVNALYRQILADARHSDVQLLAYKDTRERAFGSWTMAFIKSSEVDPGALRAYTKGEKFDPYTLSSEGAGEFLVAIAAPARKRLDLQR